MSSLARGIVLSFLLLLFFASLEIVSALPDPSSVYCMEMGYNYTIIKLEDSSEIGYCIFPDNTSCPVWNFLCWNLWSKLELLCDTSLLFKKGIKVVKF